MKPEQQERDEENSDGKPLSKAEKLERAVKRALTLYKNNVEHEEHLRKIDDLKARFADLVKSATDLGRSLARHEQKQDLAPCPEGKEDDGYSWHLSFSGFLEGIFAERANFPMSLFGGFFVKTPHGNILFDPGNGTSGGLREMGIDISAETDLIVVSHYHYSVRYDLHLTLNEMGAFPLDDESEKARKRVHFLSTEAVIKGRNQHPRVITPPYARVIDPLVVKPNMAFKIFRQEGKCRIEQYRESDAAPEGDFLLLRTFPAYHDEVARPGEARDNPACNGQEVSSYFLTDGTFGVFFTGDTEYREAAFKEDLKDLVGSTRVDVLVANMKTIEYLPLIPRADNEAIDPENLHLTKNQLGFEGLKKLTQLLRPRRLVIRALGLECVVERKEGEKRFDYAPDRLGVYQRWLYHLLTRDRNGTRIQEIDDIVIPIRHEMRLRRSTHAEDGKAVITSYSSIPAVPTDDVLTVGGRFVTGHDGLINQISWGKHILVNEENPFIVIQGKTGIGKTELAESMAEEIRKTLHPNDRTERDAQKETKTVTGRETVQNYDLALASTDKNTFRAELFGCVKDFFPGVRDQPGMLGADNGILILNQLETLPMDLSKTFLDMLEQWRYRKLGEPEMQDVKVKIIFTTNKDVDDQSNLSADLRNRLRHRLLVIPSLEHLPPHVRRRELSLFISAWCKRERVVINSPSWDLLLKADLSEGAVRCLRNLLEKARSFAEEEHWIYRIKNKKNKPIVFIREDEVLKAMKENGVRLMRDTFTFGEKLDMRTAVVVAIWVSYGCINDATCKELCTGERKSSRSFKLWLHDFRDHFGRSEKAWEYLTTSDAMKALVGGSIDDYIKALGVTDDSVSLGRLFNSGNDPQWKEERAKALADALMEHRTKEKFLRELEKPAKR